MNLYRVDLHWNLAGQTTVSGYVLSHCPIQAVEGFLKHLKREAGNDRIAVKLIATADLESAQGDVSALILFAV